MLLLEGKRLRRPLQNIFPSPTPKFLGTMLGDFLPQQGINIDNKIPGNI